MSRRAPLLLAGEPELISSGLAPDRHPLNQPMWESATNVRFYQGKVRRLVPAALVTSPFSADYKSRGLHQQQNSDGVRWIWNAQIDSGGGLAIARWYGPAAQIVHSEAGGIINDTVLHKTMQVDFQQWGDWTIYNLGAYSVPYRFIPPATVAALPNAPACIGIMKKQNQLICLGTGLGRRGIAWSDADDITVWAAAADNLAGSLTIEELQTPMRAFARLGQNVACYTEDQMALVYWVGEPFYYGQRVALDGIGAVSKTAVCADGRLNYGMSRNGAWRTDGNSFVYIDHGVVSDYFQNTINWDQSGKIVVARNDVTRCIEFHFPTGSTMENNEAWSYDPTSGSWGRVTAYQSMTERMLFDKPLTASTGKIYLLDDDPVEVGALSLVTKPLTIDLEGQQGIHVDARIDEVEIAALRASNVQFRIRNATDIDGPWENSDWYTISPDMRTYRIDYLPTGTYHKLEFQNTATNWDLDLQGFALFGFIEGTKRDEI